MSEENAPKERKGGDQYPPHRFSSKQEFAMNAGLKIKKLGREIAQQKKEARGIYQEDEK